jgi:hypothetical protein
MVAGLHELGVAVTNPEAYSLMVKRTAHNGDIVGSSPTKPRPRPYASRGGPPGGRRCAVYASSWISGCRVPRQLFATASDQVGTIYKKGAVPGGTLLQQFTNNAPYKQPVAAPMKQGYTLAALLSSRMHRLAKRGLFVVRRSV